MSNILSITVILMCISGGYSLIAQSEVCKAKPLEHLRDLEIKLNFNEFVWEKYISRETKIKYFKSLLFATASLAGLAIYLLSLNNYLWSFISGIFFLASAIYNVIIFQRHKLDLTK